MNQNKKCHFSNARLLLGILLLCLLPAGRVNAAMTSQDLELFKNANSLYYSEKYDGAEKIYSELHKKYPEYGAVAYNLGNAYYRLGKMGRAILSYERALQREPRNRDIERNLEQAKAELSYKIEDKRNWYLKAAEISLQKFTEDEISSVLALSYFLFAASLVLPLFLGKGLRFGLVQKILIVLLLSMTAVYAAKRVEVRVIRDAIVMSKKAEVRFGPSDGDRVAFKLGEGLKVYVVKSRSDWSRIILTNGEDGWIKNSSIAEVAV